MKTVVVLQSDIDDGARGGCSDCPLALAITRAFELGDCVEASIWIDGKCYWTNTFTGRYRSVPLPIEAVRWFRRFDAGEKVEPFSFRQSSAGLSMVPL